jgi:hypothetical protein
MIGGDAMRDPAQAGFELRAMPCIALFGMRLPWAMHRPSFARLPQFYYLTSTFRRYIVSIGTPESLF